VALYPSDSDDNEDPILRLLDVPFEDDEESTTVNFYPEVEDGNDKSDKDDVTKRLARLEAENEALKASAAPMYQPYTAPAAPVPQTPHYNAPTSLFPSTNDQARQDAINQLNQKFASNPGEALLEVFMQGQRTAEEANKRNLYPVAAQNTRFAINQYASTSGMDSDTRAEFDKLVSAFTQEQLASADPSKLEDNLKIIRATARGLAAETQEKNNARRNVPPPFAGSGGRGGTPVQLKLSKQQKYAWELGKAQGLKDSDLHELYKKGDL
jgi:hypothetical protein